MKIIVSEKVNQALKNLNDIDLATESADFYLSFDNISDGFEKGFEAYKKSLELNCNVYKTALYIFEFYILASTEDEAVFKIQNWKWSD
jgi:hypothetical protein